MLVVAALNRPSNGFQAKIVNQGQRNIRTGTWQVRTMVVVEAGGQDEQRENPHGTTESATLRLSSGLS
jgi:hypothetical protein